MSPRAQTQCSRIKGSTEKALKGFGKRFLSALLVYAWQFLLFGQDIDRVEDNGRTVKEEFANSHSEKYEAHRYPTVAFHNSTFIGANIVTKPGESNYFGLVLTPADDVLNDQRPSYNGAPNKTKRQKENNTTNKKQRSRPPIDKG